MMLQCEKLMGLGLAEKRDVLEKSGLCTFCLKHAADLECYGKGGLSKPRCTQSGCDGEHTPRVHKLMGEDNAGVNVVAGDESEDEDEVREEDEDEGWWVGTVGVVETPDWMGEVTGIAPGLGLAQDTDQGEVECEPESQMNECSGSEMTEDEWWELELAHPSLEKGGAGASHPKPPQRPLSGVGLPPRLAGDRQRKLKKRPRAVVDQHWEEARRSARLRQMLSDTTSDEDEDEERYGRFAESGRWMSELYRLPQYLTTTSGGEFSG
jgi:hypothetical protein